MKLLLKNKKSSAHPVRSITRYERIKFFIAGMSMFAAGVLRVKIGTAYFAQCSSFRLNDIRISGCRITRPAEILSYAGIQKA